jgi:hypothetical protein
LGTVAKLRVTLSEAGAERTIIGGADHAAHLARRTALAEAIHAMQARFARYSLRISGPASPAERKRSVEDAGSPRRRGASVTLRPEMHPFLIPRTYAITAWRHDNPSVMRADVSKSGLD